jgi:hypothetical protein
MAQRTEKDLREQSELPGNAMILAFHPGKRTFRPMRTRLYCDMRIFR